VAYPVERHWGHISTLKTFGHPFVDYARKLLIILLVLAARNFEHPRPPGNLILL
jgi:hypothetical protein